MAIAVTDVDAKCKLKDVQGTLWYFYVRNKKKKEITLHWQFFVHLQIIFYTYARFVVVTR